VSFVAPLRADDAKVFIITTEISSALGTVPSRSAHVCEQARGFMSVWMWVWLDACVYLWRNVMRLSRRGGDMSARACVYMSPVLCVRVRHGGFGCMANKSRAISNVLICDRSVLDAGLRHRTSAAAAATRPCPSWSIESMYAH
jgi:hypothetical protein